jgi:hypothetical protein
MSGHEQLTQVLADLQSSGHLISPQVIFLCVLILCRLREVKDKCKDGSLGAEVLSSRVFSAATRSSDATVSLKVTPEHVLPGHPCQSFHYLIDRLLSLCNNPWRLLLKHRPA